MNPCSTKWFLPLTSINEGIILAKYSHFHLQTHHLLAVLVRYQDHFTVLNGGLHLVIYDNRSQIIVYNKLLKAEVLLAVIG